MIEKEEEEFYKTRTECKACTKQNSAERYALNKGRRSEIMKKWYSNNKERHAASGRLWVENNREKSREIKRAWQKRNSDKDLVKVRRYQMKKLNAQPSWTNEFFIKEAYALAKLRTEIFGFPWHVDHVIPLQGKIVCGLHVENNLQVIPASENVRKSNKYGE